MQTPKPKSGNFAKLAAARGAAVASALPLKKRKKAPYGGKKGNGSGQ